MIENEPGLAYKAEALKALNKLLSVSTEQPLNEDGTPKIIISIDVAEGIVTDSWYRKSHFTQARGWFGILVSMNLITDDELKRRIEAFYDMIDSDEFSDRLPTTDDQVKIGYELVKDVAIYLQQE